MSTSGTQISLLGIFTEVLKKQSYKGSALPKVFSNEREAHGIFSFENFRADFAFLLKGGAPGVKNLLTVRILQSENSPLYLSLWEVMLSIFPDRYIHYDYPFIAAEDQLRAVLEELHRTFGEALPHLEAYFSSSENRRTLFGERAEEINRYFKEKHLIYNGKAYMPNEEFGYGDQTYASKIVTYFGKIKNAFYFTPPFTYFYESKPQKALEKMRRAADRDALIGKLLDVHTDNIFFTPLQKELYLLSRKPNRLSVLPKILLTFLLTGAATVIPGSLFFFLIYSIAAGAFDSSTVFSTALSPEQLGFLTIPVLFLGYISLCFDQRLIYRFCYPKKLYKSYAAMFTRGEQKFLRFFGSIALSAVIILTVLMGGATVRFEKECIADGSAFFSLAETRYLYAQIEKAGWVENRDENGRLISEAHLVLQMNDGKVLDLSVYADKENIDKKILPLLKEHQIEILHYDSYKEFTAEKPIASPQQTRRNHHNETV